MNHFLNIKKGFSFVNDVMLRYKKVGTQKCGSAEPGECVMCKNKHMYKMSKQDIQDD